MGYSRDGWSLTRPDRRGFCPVSENKGDWNYAYVQSAGGGCLVVGDQLYFYWSGRGAGRVTSLAVLRRDGFALIEAGDKEGTLTTRPVSFKGKYLFVNVDAPAGELRTEVLDEKAEAIKPYRAAHCAARSRQQDLTAGGVERRGRFGTAGGEDGEVPLPPSQEASCTPSGTAQKSPGPARSSLAAI